MTFFDYSNDDHVHMNINLTNDDHQLYNKIYRHLHVLNLRIVREKSLFSLKQKTIVVFYDNWLKCLKAD